MPSAGGQSLRSRRRGVSSFDFSAERRFIKEGDVTLLASKFSPVKTLRKKARPEGKYPTLLILIYLDRKY
jgi:hypothetical protein